MSMEKELAKAVMENMPLAVKLQPDNPVENTTAQPREQTVNRISQPAHVSTLSSGTNPVQSLNAHNPLEAVQLALTAVTRLEESCIATSERLVGPARLHTPPLSTVHSRTNDERSTVGRIAAMTAEIEQRCNRMVVLLEQLRTTFS
jgi:hypothetical protein